MSPTASIEAKHLDAAPLSLDSQSKPKEKTNVGENKAMIGARHGYDFVDLITMALMLKAGSMMKKDDLFSCEISKEDATAGKFDDIVFRYSYKGSAATLKIQLKHKISNEGVVKLEELVAPTASKSFGLVKYFLSCLEQKDKTNDKQKFILCTNAQLEEKVKKWLDPVNSKDNCDIFDPIGASCYRLSKKSDVKQNTENPITSTLKKASESYRLAELLAGHIHGQKEIVLFAAKNDQKVTLLVKYNKAIVHHMLEYFKDEKVFRIKEGFTTNTQSNVQNFRLSFEAAYKEIAIRFSKNVIPNISAEHHDVYADIKNKSLKSNNKELIKLIEELDLSKQSAVFPEDDVNEKDIDWFSDKFLIVCDTINTDVLQARILKFWKSHDICGFNSLGEFEMKIAFHHLQKHVSNWIKSSSNHSPLDAEEIKKVLKKLNSYQKYNHLYCASENYKKDLQHLTLTVKIESLKKKTFFKTLTSFVAESADGNKLATKEIFIFRTHYSLRMSSEIVYQTLNLIPNLKNDIIFVDVNTQKNKLDAITDILQSFDLPLVMVIEFETSDQLKTCEKKCRSLLKQNDKHCIKLILIECNAIEKCSFKINEFEKSSVDALIKAHGWNRPFGMFASEKVFQQENDDVAILLNLMEDERNSLLKTCLVDDHYKTIEAFYVQRDENFIPYLPIRRLNSDKILFPHQTKMSWYSFFDTLNKVQYYSVLQENDIKQIITNLENKVSSDLPADQVNSQDKFHILWGKAGYGKSSYLSWLGWYLQNKDRSAWVLRFNFIEYSSYFKCLEEEKKSLDQTVAMRFLYRMIHLTIFRKICQQTPADIEIVRKEAEQCAVLLEFDADSKAIKVNEVKWKSSRMTALQLILMRLFKEKFNERSLVLLFDGFDEIVPYYKDVAFNILTRIRAFDGIKVLYLTSRPYNLPKEFESKFTGAKMHSLASFTQSDRLAALHLFMNASFEDYKKTSMEQQTYLLGGLLHTIEIYLKGLCANPIYMKIAMSTISTFIKESVNFKENTVATEIKHDIEKLFEKVQLIDKFINDILYNSNIEKPGIESSADTSIMRTKLEESNKLTLRKCRVLALYAIFGKEDVISLHGDENEAHEYMDSIRHGKEKTGIIEAVFDSKPVFIHRTFAEYFAACWLFEHKNRQDVKRFLKSFSYWAENRRELREYFDRLLVRESDSKLISIHHVFDHKFHDIMEKLNADKTMVSLREKDGGGRTIVHLMTIYYKYDLEDEEDLLAKVLHLQPDVDERDVVLNWTALNYALIQFNKTAVNTLLDRGAKFEPTELTESLLTCTGVEMFHKAVKYEKLFTKLAIRNATILNVTDIYEKEVCKSVAECLIGNKMLDLGVPLSGWKFGGFTPVQYCAAKDAIAMLRSLVHRTGGLEEVFPEGTESILNIAFSKRAVNVIGYFVLENQCEVPPAVEVETLVSAMKECVFRRCNKLFTFLLKTYCVRKGMPYIELPAFHRHHCEAGSTQFPSTEKYEKEIVDDNLEREIHLAGIDKGIFELILVAIWCSNAYAVDSVLQMTQLDVSNRMIRCVLNAIGSVKSTDNSMLEYLLRKATNLRAIDGEGMTMLHLLIVLRQYSLAKYLIDEYDFGIEEINTQNGWNAFHYCANIPFPETNQNRQARMDLLEHMMTKDQTNLFVRDNQGKNVLHHAVMNRHFWIAKCILQRKLKTCTTEDRPSAVNIFLSSAGLIGTKQCSDFLENDLKGDEEFWKPTPNQTLANHNIGNTFNKKFVKV